ncbi:MULTISPECIES: YagK/YfjJ domain-containing protein [unclassified Pseudoalteromonas]|uniref:YagK/YfjJ domain-containing protein n=1 Tax=unclassified Pseudoalteromonas TaxID=194690 RepID=UPI001F2DD1BE|nr:MULTISPECIES: inovirus-type Gp2 protein [unclassified Pseudoalteromonas]MCF2825916.1 inovirus Gp2 family protein [Pseudoalteromonas sp. OF5H-5]MCF2834299.1 inovirus Gp2 family protein [Pseudoalteromonas sp. DL2-H6]MCF2925425.1 inovirus Gp2 family protein [Pseudoalteromonas sp. DL2-H1]
MKKLSQRVQTNPFDKRYKVIVNHKEIIESKFEEALSEYSRISVVRFDLHIPRQCKGEDNPLASNESLMKRFIASLVSKLKYSYLRKPVSRTQILRYVWVKEKGKSGNEHYHVCLFLDKDHFGMLRSYSKGYSYLLSYKKPKKKSVQECIVEAWASALSIEPQLAEINVQFSDSKVHWINLNDQKMQSEEYRNVMKRLMYMAKPETKFVDLSKTRYIGHGSPTIKLKSLPVRA